MRDPITTTGDRRPSDPIAQRQPDASPPPVSLDYCKQIPVGDMGALSSSGWPWVGGEEEPCHISIIFPVL